MLVEAKEDDQVRDGWRKRIAGGLKGVRVVHVTFELASGGFAMDQYVLPFEKDRMKADLNEWTSRCRNITKNEIPVEF